MASSNSFKSFAEILNETQRLSEILENAENYFAHIHPEKPPEPLQQHIDAVAAGVLHLINSHQLDLVVDKMLTDVLPPYQEYSPRDIGNIMKKFFINAILFHDYGKINENFQLERMKNTSGNLSARNNAIKSQHSVLGGFLFIIFHVKDIREKFANNLQAVTFLVTACLYFAGVILKHHHSHLEINLNFEPKVIQALQEYLDLFGIEKDIFYRIIFEEQRIQGFRNSFLKQLSPDMEFIFFALLKLNYSLLTAADYLATFSYSTNITSIPPGILSAAKTTQLHENFWNLKSYNQQLKKEAASSWEEWIDKNTHSKDLDLSKRNPNNLNLLRKLLLAEAMVNIRQYSNHNIFYLEAPTGSGKTNLSLGIALELIKTNPSLNKLFYVFPYTTLVTQTFHAIRETLGISGNEIIQLHSRTGFHQVEESKKDGLYGSERRNFVQNLFVNYPITLLTHVRFFDVLKANSKEANYLLHRLANSVVIIDELQTYPPGEWDKICYFIVKYAHYFSIKFILMSATLPRLDTLQFDKLSQHFQPLILNPERYFQNPNFCERVLFDFSLIEEISQWDIPNLAHRIFDICLGEKEARRIIIEFITKKSATRFYKFIQKECLFADYEILVLSGTILEPRRREIIAKLKEKTADKILLVCTQVVEAGVDIDMDIGFKDTSLIDSDEQLAGRVNREATKNGSVVYLFNLDRADRIYGADLRYQAMREEQIRDEYREILLKKNFHKLYREVFKRITQINEDEFTRNLNDYKGKIRSLSFSDVHRDFKLINSTSYSVFVPVKFETKFFSDSELAFLNNLGVRELERKIDGARVWEAFIRIVQFPKDDLILQKIDLKQIYGIMSNFIFSVFKNQYEKMKEYADLEYDYEILYLSRWREVYDLDSGIKDEKFHESMAFL